MGSGVWFKNIISKKKVKGDRSQKSKRYAAPESINGCKEKHCLVSDKGVSVEEAAATQIQTAYRAHVARKAFRRIRGLVRLKNLVERDFVKKQASATLNHLHSWTRTQAQITARRANMVTESQLKQKKLENQMKLDAKIHDFEVVWNHGAETKGEALAKIHQREEAAVRRERAMAYAFSHQWRANSSPSFGSGNQEISKANWGWSWMDRWIAARPWESRVAALESPKKPHSPHPKKMARNSISPTANKVKLVVSPNGKATPGKARKLSYGAAAKKANPKGEEEKVQMINC